jgi:hypothetical protein
MKLRLAVLMALALIPAPGVARERGHGHGHGTFGEHERPGYANPTALIAAEIAMSQLAKQKGQWKAMRDNAAPDAEMFEPGPVKALDWLKRRDEPPTATSWNPRAVWMSCDGSYGVVAGGYSTGDQTGRYAAVWQRQDKGDYKWLLRQQLPGQAAAGDPDMLAATVADCARQERRGGDSVKKKSPAKRPAAPPVEAQSGWSADRTLYWRADKDASGEPTLLVSIRKDGAMRTVLGEGSGPQAGGESPSGERL